MYQVYYQKRENREEYIILYDYKPEKEKYAYKYNVICIRCIIRRERIEKSILYYIILYYIILLYYNTKLMYEKINNTSILLEDWYDYKS